MDLISHYLIKNALRQMLLYSEIGKKAVTNSVLSNFETETTTYVYVLIL